MSRPGRALGLALSLALLAAGCSEATAPSPQGGRPARNATTAPLLPLYADALPVTELAGYEELLGQLRGTPVVVNFWASWCDPCKEEMPLLVDAHARYGDRVQFLGVDLLDSRDGAVRFVSGYGMDFPSLFDPDNDIGFAYDLFAPPLTLFIDESGAIVETIPGQVPEETLETNLKALTT